MCIEYRGVICVGYTFNELEQIMEHKGFEEDSYKFVKSEGLSYFSPHFCADRDSCIYGYKLIASDDYCFAVIPDIDVKASLLKEKLYNKYGIDANTYLMADGH